LARLKISDETLALFPRREALASQSLAWALMAVLGAPIALYGAVHRFVPHLLVKWAKRKFTHADRRKAQASTASIEAGAIAYVLCYAAYVSVFHAFFGWPWSLWYALSLPPAGMLAYYYGRELRKLDAAIRNTSVLLRAPSAARRL